MNYHTLEELVQCVKDWGIEKGITGDEGRGTLLGQLDKSQEELTETRDAAVKLLHPINEAAHWTALDELKDGIGDTTVTLILLAELAGLSFADCLAQAYGEIAGRTGNMIDGIFVKD
jgi:hypothetical protein